MRSVVVVVLALVTQISLAHAQPSFGGPPSMVEPSAPPPSSGHKSRSTAVLLALGAMAATTALTVVAGNASANCLDNCAGPNAAFVLSGLAMVVSPSAGQIYAGRRVTPAMVTRFAGVTAMGLGWLAIVPCMVRNGAVVAGQGATLSSGPGDACGIGAAALTGGLIAAFVGTVWDVAATPAAVDAYNRAHDARAARLSIAPIATASGVAPGIALGGRF